MYGYPSQLRGSQTTAKRRHNEIFSQVQVERQASRARAASRAKDSILVILRRQTGQLLIAVGQLITGLQDPIVQSELEPPVRP